MATATKPVVPRSTGARKKLAAKKAAEAAVDAATPDIVPVAPKPKGAAARKRAVAKVQADKAQAMEELGKVLAEAGKDDEDGDDFEDSIPFPGDPRPVREQVNDHEYLVVHVDMRPAAIDGELDTPCAWYYDHFDTLKDAKAYAEEVKLWVTEDIRTQDDDPRWVVAYLATGFPLEVKSVTAHGYSDRKVQLATAKLFTSNPEANFFEVGATPTNKPKSRPRKKVAEDVTPVARKGKRPVKKAAPKADDGGVEVTPVVRSKGFRAKARSKTVA